MPSLNALRDALQKVPEKDFDGTVNKYGGPAVDYWDAHRALGEGRSKTIEVMVESEDR